MYFRFYVLATSIFAASVSIISVPAGAASLEDQMKGLEASVKTVDQRRRESIKDINVNVLQAYRDAIKIESVDTDIAEVFDRTAKVRVVVKYRVDFDETKAVRATLSKYFETATDKEFGVEPYGRIYPNYHSCVGAYCAVKQDTMKLLKNTAIGINASFLGEWEPGIITSAGGNFELASGTLTFLIDVPKSKIKGNPKPVVKTQIYNAHFCNVGTGCTGVSYSKR